MDDAQDSLCLAEVWRGENGRLGSGAAEIPGTHIGQCIVQRGLRVRFGQVERFDEIAFLSLTFARGGKFTIFAAAFPTSRTQQ